RLARSFESGAEGALLRQTRRRLFVAHFLLLIRISYLADPTTAYRIYCATLGKVANVMKLIRRSVAITLANGEEKITLETLSTAYAERLEDNQPEIKNPFLQ
ncbi:MAG: hypothetical protein QOH25_1554, partial [Acidobacteriota bacterium]|nr:hypothetical protein [Acidobacteriota bacterium]